MSDDFGEVYMSTLATLDNPIRDEYDRDVMENLDNVADEYPDAEVVQDQIVWNHPSFTDISTWEIYRPSDENVRVHHPNSPDLREDTIFSNKENVMLAVQRYSILNRVDFKVRKSDSKKLVLECRKGEEMCLWRLRVVVIARTTYWTVRKNRGDHVCHNNSILQNNIHLNAQFIAREMRNAMDANTKFSSGHIRNLIQRDYGHGKHNRKRWSTFSANGTNFNKLPHLIQALQDSSPNNFVKWDVTSLDDGTMLVNRIFWAFSECILAFNHYCPILPIDGTHMYGKYNAKLLIAIGLDANNHILPLAFALVESEKTSSWKWHAGILAAMCEPEWRDPKAYHRVCVRYLQSNFMTKVKDEVLKAFLGDVAYAKKELKFRKKFGELLELLKDKPLARKWLVDMDVEIWTRAFDHGGFRWGNMTTNASECLNKILKNGRDLPVSSLVMYTFKQSEVQ
ncbi:hypothetical protein QQ045_030387 [Rhodiola kirilowii]